MPLTIGLSIDFSERKPGKIKRKPVNSVTKKCQELNVFRDFEKQLAVDYRSKRPYLTVPGKYFAHLMPSKLSLSLNFSPSD